MPTPFEEPVHRLKLTGREASVRVRQIKRASQLRPQRWFCKICEAHHVALQATDVAPGDVQILTCLAMGLRWHEIAADVGRTERTVKRRIQCMQERYGALNATNLVVLAVAFGIIEIAAFIPRMEQHAESSNL